MFPCIDFYPIKEIELENEVFQVWPVQLLYLQNLSGKGQLKSNVFQQFSFLGLFLDEDLSDIQQKSKIKKRWNATFLVSNKYTTKIVLIFYYLF